MEGGEREIQATVDVIEKKRQVGLNSLLIFSSLFSYSFLKCIEISSPNTIMFIFFMISSFAISCIGFFLWYPRKIKYTGFSPKHYLIDEVLGVTSNSEVTFLYNRVERIQRSIDSNDKILESVNMWQHVLLGSIIFFLFSSLSFFLCSFS